MVFAARLSEVPEWGKKVVEIAGERILLIRTKGVVYACETECPHQGAPLEGALVKEAGRVSCPRHGYRFDLATGACEGRPDLTLKVYRVELQGEEVWVEV